MTNFNEMDIDDGIKSALTDMGFESPTPIQAEVIPLILDGRDVIAQSPTGTGKTCAFGIPIINNTDWTATEVQTVILCPTRELVIQTENELRDVAKNNKEIKIVSIYGGQNIDRQLAGLRRKPQIIIGTTGRVMDHLRRKTLKLASLKTLVLDEVDEMLNMGFREDIDTILKTVPAERQTVLFSATMPKEIVEISKRYQNDPVTVKAQHQKSDIPNINQYYITVAESDKITALVSLMQQKSYGLALVFCNTKKRVDELNMHLNDMGINSDALHGDLRQHSRDKTMKKFRGGETQMLIATDVAARGIDVDNIGAVFNFDIPHDEENYVHRIGRTARANEVGDAYTFVTPRQMNSIKMFERYTKNPIVKAEFLAAQAENEIDQKLFDKTLKLIKKADLATYKDFIIAELERNNTTGLDIAAALLMQLNETHSTKAAIMSEPPKAATKTRKPSKDSGGGMSSGSREGGRSSRSGGKSSNVGVKFFMNVGTRDKCDASSIAKFINTNAGIPLENIISINCLENFSFATLTEGNNDPMDYLNGIKFNKRILAVEVASNDRPKTTKPFPPKSDKPAKFDKSDKPAKSYKSDKPSGSDNFDKPAKKTDRKKSLNHYDKLPPRKKGKY